MQVFIARVALVAGALAIVAAATGCGRSQAVPAAPPPPLPLALIPTTLGGGTFQILENTDEATLEAFTGAGERTLAGDGKLWEIRDAQRLVGTLQLTTLKSKIETTEKADRDSIVRQALPGSVNRLEVEDVTIYSTSSNDKVVYLWFGKQVFQIMQLKGTELDPERLLGELVQFQLSTTQGPDVLLRGDLEEEEEPIRRMR